MDRNNDHPPKGFAVLDYESDSDVSLTETVVESEGDDSDIVGNDANTLTSPAPTVTSEGARRGRDPA